MLPYDREVLLSLYAHSVDALWSLALVVCLLSLTAPGLAWRGGKNSGRTGAALLAVGWLWVGIVFHYQYFSTINFAAPLYAGLFVLQAILLAWQGVLRNRLAFRFSATLAGRLGVMTLAFATIAYPVSDLIGATPAAVPRVVGLAPGPTALFTLGLLLHSRTRIPLHLLAVPLIWSLVAGFNGWVLDDPVDLIAPVIGVSAVLAAMATNRKQVMAASSGH